MGGLAGSGGVFRIEGSRTNDLLPLFLKAGGGSAVFAPPNGVDVDPRGSREGEAPGGEESSSSMSNIRSTVESLGRIHGLAAAFRGVFCRFGVIYPVGGDSAPSKPPIRALNELENLPSSSLREILNAISRSFRCLSSSSSPTRLGWRSCRSSSARPLLANGKHASWFSRTTSSSSASRSSSRSLSNLNGN